MQVKVTDQCLGSDTYDCKLSWPDQTEGRAHEVRPDGKDLLAAELEAEFAVEEGKPPPPPRPKKYTFIAYPPAPANIPVRDKYYGGLGFRRQKIVAVGHGLNFEEAEVQAFDNFRKVEACDHEWYRHTMSDPAHTMLLDGDCSCRKCRIYVHSMQMDQQLFDSMNLAYRAHDGQHRKYNGAPYIGHPHQVYSRVAWWKALPEKQWLLMARAAWLHDVKEDCPHITDEEIIQAAGEDGFKLVCELTNPSKGSRAPRRVRKQMDRDHLAHVSWEAKIIKLFDRIVNLRDMEKCPEKDFIGLYASESMALYEILKDADEGLAKELLSWVRAAEKWSKQ